MLKVCIVRPAERPAERKVAVKHPWWTSAFGLTSNEAEPTVARPACSNRWASALTVRVHSGQTGVRKTICTPSSSSCCAAAGPVSRRNVVRL
jgi:hypothetical protein